MAKKQTPKFDEDSNFIIANLKAQLVERDRRIVQLETAFSDLDRGANRIYAALEEAEALASKYAAMVQEALVDPAKYKRHQQEMPRFVQLFREARSAFQSLRP
jgi:hypothetical protein